MSYDQSQLVHLLTVLQDRSPAIQMLQSILQTLDATKRIKILLLTNGYDDRNSENFADKLVDFLSGTNYLFELQVVQLGTEDKEINEAPTNYQIFDIDRKKSNALIATRIVELFQSNSYQEIEKERLQKNCDKQAVATDCTLDVDGKQLNDLVGTRCDFCRTTTIGNYKRGYYVIFLLIFAIPILLLLFDIFITSIKK